MDRAKLELALAALPLYQYAFLPPQALAFTERVRWVCAHECAMYGASWACPPAVGTVAQCRARCLAYDTCLLIATVAEVADIADIRETLATRGPHEEITDHVGALLRAQRVEPYILSTESCALCARCTWPDGGPCRHPERMHPCVESHGINLIPTLEHLGLGFQYGENVVTWVSLLLYNE